MKRIVLLIFAALLTLSCYAKGDYEDIAAGPYYVLVKKSDGSLWGWGSNYFGQLGIGSSGEGTNTDIPVKILPGGVRQISAGGSHVMVLLDGGKVVGFGNNYGGAIDPYSTWGNFVTPTAILKDWSVKAVSAGGWFSLALLSDGRLLAWGDNSKGQIGNGVHGGPAKFNIVMDNVRRVDAGFFNHSMAIRNDGSLWGWGDNKYGQIGNGSNEAVLSPVKILDNVKQVSAGGDFTVALLNDGSVWTWGKNSDGQLGDGTFTDRNTPRKVMEGVRYVAAGCHHSMAIRNDGTLWGWGMNHDGQLGNGTRKSNPLPAQIAENVKKVACGGFFSIYLTQDGDLMFTGNLVSK